MSRSESPAFVRRDITSVYEPHPWTVERLDLRRWATGETAQTAQRELAASDDVVPLPGTAQMEGEAQVFSALIASYGRHRPALTGGPFGIMSVTPKPGELVACLSPDQPTHWARALAVATGPRGHGVAALRWAHRDDDIVLTLDGMRIVLAQTAEHAWERAVDQASLPDGQHHPNARIAPETTPVDAAERAHRERYRARLRGLAPQMSATLRRIGLLATVAARHSTVELLVTTHRGVPYLLDASAGWPSTIPLWSSLSVRWTCGRPRSRTMRSRPLTRAPR
ncbi:hypothetical protein [Actinacidiphila oryziradicis]|uniref:Uncharacterized protein n=1 Tax=Actinacidiphila oryziradicis TaxID=2571141 RepID=A0A4U0SAM8_9ACTN|nr:hypothetical protein [Actinacidiphila oryziradicis]TKA06380.1 hypothetical protein FCI23_31840 [Actinacidiphila oryziradicis]